MPIPVTCPNCAAVLAAPDSAAGRTGPCPKCQAPVTVPAPPAAVEAEPDAALPMAEDDTEVAVPAEAGAIGRKRARWGKSHYLQLALGLGLALAGVAALVTLLVTGAWLPAGTAPEPAAPDPAGRPHRAGVAGPKSWVPTDPDKLPPHRAAARSAFLASVLPAFDAANPASAPRREDGRRALEAYAYYVAHEYRSDLLTAYTHRAVGRVVADGCRDPYVRYAAARLALAAHAPDAGWDAVVRVAEEVGRSGYPAARRMHALYNAAANCPDAYSVPAAERRALAARLTDDFWRVYAEVAADHSPPAERDLLEVTRLLVGREDALGGDRHANYRRAKEVLAAAGAREWVRRAADGIYHTHNGLIRLNGDAAIAPPEDRAAAHKELELARTDLEKAWESNPADATAPTYLITVVDRLDRPVDEAEEWFRRAMAADPDNHRACVAELGVLDRRRGKSVDELFRFARWCRETGNWDGGIPQVGADAYGRVNDPPLLGSPARWSEVKALFDNWLVAHPESGTALSQYALAAMRADHAAEAAPLFERLAGRPSPEVFPDRVKYDRLVAQAYMAAGRAAPPHTPSDLPTSAAAKLLSDQGRRAAHRKDRRDWFANAYREAFVKHYPADRKGHAEGLAALTAVADAEAPHFPRGRHMDVAWAALGKAVAAGCTDPLVRSLHARLGAATGQLADDKAAPARGRAATAALLKSPYPDILKLPAAFDAVLDVADGGDGRAVAARAAALWPVLAGAAADPAPVARGEVLHAAAVLMDLESPGLPRAKVYEKLKAAFAGSKAGEYPGLVLDGIELTAAAWDARGGATAADVAPGQFDVFFARLRRAEAALARAWRLAPDRPEAPTRMITVCMGLQHPRSEALRWFARAADADPDNYDAVRRLGTYLEPKWYGEPIGMDLLWIRSLGFAATKCEGGFGLLAYEFEALARYEYMRAAPEDRRVWGEVEHPIKTWLKAAPDCRYAKTVYALAAVRAGQLATADRLFRELGDKPWPGVFPSREVYRQTTAAVHRELGNRID